VLAPHADDEALGCGGAIHKHHLAGHHVTAAFMTDGSQGFEMAEGLQGQELVKTREQEAKDAAGVLGVNDLLFLGYPDTNLEASQSLVCKLEEILHAIRPDVLYAPSPMDTHRDHLHTTLAAAKAIARCSWPIDVYLYEIWAPVPANCAIAIDLEHKLKAVRAYKSQMDDRELYVKAAVGLAHYRGITCVPGELIPVECFLRLDRSDLAALAATLA